MPIDPLVLAMMSGGGGQNAAMMDPTYAAAIPRLQLAQQLMQEGTSAAPAYPMQGVARVIQSLAGNVMMNKAMQGLAGSEGGAAQAAAATLPDGHPLKAALTSSNPLVQFQAMQAYKAALTQMGEPYSLNPGQQRNIGNTTIAQSTAPQSPEGKLQADIASAGANGVNLPQAVGQAQSTIAANSAPGEATKAGAVSMAQLPAEITKSLAENGLTINPQGQIVQMPGYAGANAGVKGAQAGAEAQAQNPALIQRAAGVAAAELPYKVTEDAANYALRPVPLSPTERLQSGFNALPPQLQGAITSSVNQLPSVMAPQTPQPTVPFRLPQQATGHGPALQPSVPQSAPSVTSRPSQVSAGQGGSGGTVPPAMTPAQFEAEQKLGQDFATTDKKAYDAANQSLGMLTGINNAIETLNQSGWTTTGTGMDARMGLSKGINTISAMFGGDPVLDPSKVASWEAFNKQTKLMGMQVINNYFGGSREAASIINGATTAVPNSENSYLGARLVSSGIEQDLQRQRELYQFKAERIAQGLPLSTAETDFNKDHPPQVYMHRAIANAIPDPIVNHLIQNPSTVAAFDKHFGPGIGEFILQGGRTQMGMAGLSQQ